MRVVQQRAAQQRRAEVIIEVMTENVTAMADAGHSVEVKQPIAIGASKLKSSSSSGFLDRARPRL